MSSSALVHGRDTRALPVLDPHAWREHLLGLLQTGWRVISLFGRRDSDAVIVTALLLSPKHVVEVLRSRVPLSRGYHELTSQFPGLHCFERELHEQTGLPIVGHPWLKPIRHEVPALHPMNGYPYYSVHGKEVHEVAVGPIHAGVIEPGSFRFSCLGEEVHHLEIQLGYQHRGVERLLLERDATQLAPIAETIAGDTSIGHCWAYCAALEALANCELDLGVDFGRAILLELERIGMHLASLAGLAADIGFLQGATSYGRLRTTAINTTMRLCGSRFGRAALRPGGVRMRVVPTILSEARRNIEQLRDDLETVNDLFVSARSVQHRLRGAGTIPTSLAREIGLVGVAARASDLPIDMRRAPRTGAYRLLPIHVARKPDGDCFARTLVRIDELCASLRFVTGALEYYADFQRPLKSIAALAPERLVLAVVEGFRGEVVHCLETDAQGRLLHYKVQDPSLRNWLGLALAIRGNDISDFPLCNKSFDLSYCGNDL